MKGELIQNYKIESHLGQGGMGTVYLATDTVLGREVALKMLHNSLVSQTQFLERFKKEARVLARLLHPNIAVLYNFLQQGEDYYMVMEYVEGRTLDQLLKQYPAISYRALVPMFTQVLEGLYHAHKKGIFHRDIKPSNIILAPDGVVKIMDFGIARIAGEQKLTQVNKIVGTVEFMAPELIEGKDPSIASDIYAVGITMYELLAGRLPFESNTDYNLMQEIMKKKPLHINKMNADVPKALAAIVMKAMEKKPENRFSDAREFMLALQAAFPGLKEIDVQNLGTPLQITAAPTRIVQQAGTNPNLETQVIESQPQKKTGTIGRRALPVNWAPILEKIKSRQYRPIVLAVLAIFLIIVVKFTLFNGNTRIDSQAGGQKTDSLQELVAGQENKPRTEQPVGGIAENNDNSSNFQLLPEQPGTRNEEPAPEKENKETGKKPIVEKKEPEKKQAEPEPEPKKEEPRKEEVIVPEPEKKTVEEPRRSPKSVRLDIRVPVNLTIRETLNPETIKEGQTLTFTVSNPVQYKGETIIKQGSVATARIKSVSSKKMSIVFNTVSASNGQTLGFEQVELSGRITELINNRHYTATLQKGITINF